MKECRDHPPKLRDHRQQSHHAKNPQRTEYRPRSGSRRKRSANGVRVPLTTVICNPAEHAHEMLALEEAIEGLDAMEEELGQIVDLRYFAGLTLEETAGVMELSRQQVERRWRSARAFLSSRLAPSG